MKKLTRIMKHLSQIACAILLFATICSSFSICAFAKTSYISEVALASGDDAMEQLEKSGYTVLFQGMNLMTGSDSSMVYLGYKNGSSAITDFIVSAKNKSTITYEGSAYSRVSSISLNNGTDGTALYLYCTKDSAAGDPITELDTVSGFSDKEQVIALRNDGSSPIRTDEGKLANFDKGIENNELYLLMYRAENIRQYVSDACIITAGSKASAVRAAASKGCDYYLDNDLSDDKDTVTYIGYQRTADKSQAVNAISVNGKKLTVRKSENTGAYLIDLSKNRLFDESFTLGEWAGVYAAEDKSVTRTSSAYKALAKSKEVCSCVFAGDLNIYATYLGKMKEANSTTAATTKQVQSSATQEETASQEEASDAFYDIEKTEDDTTQEKVTENDKVASVFGSGTVRNIVIFVGVILTVSVVILIFTKGRKKNEKNN